MLRKCSCEPESKKHSQEEWNEEDKKMIVCSSSVWVQHTVPPAFTKWPVQSHPLTEYVTASIMPDQAKNIYTAHFLQRHKSVHL